MRCHLWPSNIFLLSMSEPDLVKIPRVVLTHFTEMLAFAA